MTAATFTASADTYYWKKVSSTSAYADNAWTNEQGKAITKVDNGTYVDRDIVIYGSSPAAISAGTAGAMVAESGTAVQDIPYAALAARLAADGQVLSCERKGAQ